MTHKIAARTNTHLNRAPAGRLARQINELSRHWVDADFAGAEMEESGDGQLADRRFTIVKSYLVNHLGLKMFIETRVNDSRHPLQYHHLPVQEQAVIQQAISLLTPFELQQGVGVAIQELAHGKHRHSDGSIPEKKWYSYAEADALGIKLVPRNHEEKALAWISKEWVTVAMWDRRLRQEEGHGDTRLPAHVEKLMNRGYAICVEYIDNSGPSKQKIARYRYFTEEAEREEWFERKRVQEALALEDEQRRKDAKEQAKADAAAATYAAIERKHNSAQQKILDRAAKRAAEIKAKTTYKGGSEYGGWKANRTTPGGAKPQQVLPQQREIFRASANPTAKPTPVSSETRERLSSMRAASARGGYAAVLGDENKGDDE